MREERMNLRLELRQAGYDTEGLYFYRKDQECIQKMKSESLSSTSSSSSNLLLLPAPSTSRSNNSQDKLADVIELRPNRVPLGKRAA